MHSCHISNTRIGSDAPVRLMGVINCSPESFFSGSYVPRKDIFEKAVRMCEAGADFIDLGARSTAPGSPLIPVSEEIIRMDAALGELDGTGISVSVDTMHPEVLSACLSHDIHAINDISGLSDEAYARIAGDSGLPVITMAAVSRPGDALGVRATVEALEVVVSRCERHRIDEFVLDPGVGRWTDERTYEHDWEICNHFSEFLAFDRPLLAAVSRKSFIGDLLQRETEERLAGTLALTMMLIEYGASVVRCHDVAETADLLKVVSRMRGAP